MARNAVIVFQITDFVCLTLSISILIYLLHRAKKYEENRQTFRREKTALFIILISFDLSFILRFCSDRYLNKVEQHYMANVIFIILSGPIFDILPVSLILLIHSSNFKTIQFDADDETLT